MQSAGRSTNVSSAKKARHALKKTAIGVLSAASLFCAGAATQAADLKLSDDAGVSVGLGLRVSYTNRDQGAGNGIDNSNEFSAENTRIFLSGHYGKIIKGVLNFEGQGNGGNTNNILDAYVGFEFNDYFNIWMGHFLPPNDRANGYGPFYTVTWDYPLLVSRYPNVQNGRDDGVAAWGKLFNGKLVWAGGIFEGNRVAGVTAASATNELAYQGRIKYNFLDAEPAPAYLAGGWFGGSKDLLTIGLAGFTQKDGTGTPALPGKLEIWNVDFLFEKKFGPGVPTVEAAYYEYKAGQPDPGGTIVPGKAYLAGLAWMFNDVVGWGKFQPFYRYQSLKPDAVGTPEMKKQDFGVNYIIKGPNAKISAQYSKADNYNYGFVNPSAPGTSRDQFMVGVQLIY